MCGGRIEGLADPDLDSLLEGLKELDADELELADSDAEKLRDAEELAEGLRLLLSDAEVLADCEALWLNDLDSDADTELLSLELGERL